MLEVQQDAVNWKGSGFSVLEMFHRGVEFESIITQAEKDLRNLLEIPNNYKVLFLQGGATGQFAAIPMNLLGEKTTADYVLINLILSMNSRLSMDFGQRKLRKKQKSIAKLMFVRILLLLVLPQFQQNLVTLTIQHMFIIVQMKQ